MCISKWGRALWVRVRTNLRAKNIYLYELPTFCRSPHAHRHTVLSFRTQPHRTPSYSSSPFEPCLKEIRISMTSYANAHIPSGPLLYKDSKDWRERPALYSALFLFPEESSEKKKWLIFPSSSRHEITRRKRTSYLHRNSHRYLPRGNVTDSRYVDDEIPISVSVRWP